MQHARNTMEELLQLCNNLKRRRPRTLPRIAILCAVDQLIQGDDILKLLKVRINAGCSGMLTMVLSPLKL